MGVAEALVAAVEDSAAAVVTETPAAGVAVTLAEVLAEALVAAAPVAIGRCRYLR